MQFTDINSIVKFFLLGHSAGARTVLVPGFFVTRFSQSVSHFPGCNSTKYTTGENMTELIYALCEIGGWPFYVGRTGRTLEIRYKEHVYNSKAGTEHKYQFIRGLPNMEFEIVLLSEVGDDSEHFEDFWVYSLILDGYELTNMKAGDSIKAAERDAMNEFKKRGERFTDPKSFLDAREREIAEAKARKASAKLMEKTRNFAATRDYSRVRFAGNFGKEPISEALQEIMDRRRK